MLTDWQTLINTTKDFADEYWFENLKIYYASRYAIYKTLNKIDRELAKTYRKIFSRTNVDKYWQEEAAKIADFCLLSAIATEILF